MERLQLFKRGKGRKWLFLGLLFPILISKVGAQAMLPPPSKTNPCESLGIHRFDMKREPPAFFLRDLGGKEVTLRDYKGKPLLLFFWGSWCQACKEDLVLLEKFYDRFRGRLEILTIAVDGEREKKVRATIKEYRITLPVLLDQKERIARVYGVRMIPTAYLINQEGWMEGVIVGQREWNSLEAISAIQEVFGLH